MATEKEKIDEIKAIARFIFFIHKEIDTRWYELSTLIQQVTNIRFDKSCENSAKAEIKATYFALELRQMKTLLSDELVYRIRNRMNYESSKDPIMSDFWERVHEYENEFYLGIKKGEDPINNIAALAYSNLGLHCSIDRKNFERLSDTGAFINPLVLSNFAKIIAHHKPFWKPLIEHYEILKSDLPIEYQEKQYQLDDYNPKKESENHPDGTYFIKDEKGEIQKGWLPPEVFNNLLKDGLADRTYQILLKGPWDGIKQMQIQLTEELKSQYLDDNEQGYALVWYESGRLKYQLVEKFNWDKFEEAERIFHSESLSKEELIERFKELIKDPPKS